MLIGKASTANYFFKTVQQIHSLGMLLPFQKINLLNLEYKNTKIY